MHLVRFGLIAGCLVILVSCGGTDPGPSGPPEVTVGTVADIIGGDLTYTTLTNGDSIQIVKGPQAVSIGGYHIGVSVRIKGMETGDPENRDDPNNPSTLFKVLIGSTEYHLRKTPVVQGYRSTMAAGVFELSGTNVRLEINDDDVLHNQTVTLEVVVTDADGRTDSDSRTLIAIKDPSD